MNKQRRQRRAFTVSAIILFVALFLLASADLVRAVATTQSAGQLQQKGDETLALPHAILGLTPALEPALQASTTVSATKRDELAVDADGSGAPGPGDTLTYTVVITNGGATDALGLLFTDTLDANTSLVGDVLVSPIAVDDEYDALGNTAISIAAPDGVRSNDLDPDNGVISVVPVSAGLTSQGGDIEISANGAFNYDPPAGFSGSDSFEYSIEDEDGLQATGIIRFSVSSSIWYVDDDADAGGDGRLSAPFDTVGAAQAAAVTGDIIFLYEGSYDSGLTLPDALQLIGQGVDLASGAGLAPVPAGTTLPTEAISPTLSGGIVLAQDNTIRGLTVDAGAGTGVTGTTFGSLTVSNVAISGTGRALNLTGGSLDATFDNVSSLDSSSEGIRLSGVEGSLTIGKGQIAGASSAGFYVEGGTADVTYLGAIEAEDADSYAVRILNKSGGTVSLQGAVSSTGGTGRGISLSGNAGATINFGGAIALSTGLNTAFTASGGGTVNATASGSTLSTAGATALRIDGTTIGDDGVTFEAISASATDKGIVLNDAGSGGFTVSGVASNDGSGGTIQNISARGIEVMNTNNVSFANMALTNANTVDNVCAYLATVNCNAAIYLNGVTGASLNNIDVSGNIEQQGINGIGVADFTLQNSTLTGCGDDASEGCLKMRNLSGNSVITGTELALSAEKNVEIYNDSGTLTLVIADSTFRDTQSSAIGADGLEIVTDLTAQASVHISRSTFLRNRTNGLQVNGLGNSTLDVNVLSSTFDADGGLGKGIELAVIESAALTFNILNNSRIHSNGGNAVTVAAFDSSSVEGRVNDNADIQLGGAATSGNGIFAQVNDNASGRLEILNNTIGNLGWDDGIYITARPDLLLNPTGRLDVTVADNNITVDSSSLYGIELLAAETNTICGSVSDNTISGLSAAAFRVRESLGGTVLLQNFTVDAATTWTARGNTGGPVSESPAGAASAGTCTAPSNALASLNGAFAWQQPDGQHVAAPFMGANALAPAMKQTPSLAVEGEALAPAFSKALLPAAARLAAAPAQQATADVEIGPFTLPPGKSVTIIFRATVAEPYPAGAPAEVQNQGRVSGSNFTPLFTDDPDTAAPGDATSTALDLRADLALLKDDGQIAAVPGEPLTYTIVISNFGPHGVTGAAVTDNLPGSLTNANWTCEAGAGAACDASSGNGDIDETVDLNAGSALTYSVSATIDPAANGTLNNSASVAPPAAVIDPVAGNNVDADNTTLTPQVDLTLAQSESVDPLLAGSGAGNLTYVITLTNEGPSLASGVTVSETLVHPPDVTFDGAGYNAANASFGGGVWTVNQLGVGQSEVLTLTLTAPANAAAGVDVVGSSATVTGADQTVVNGGDDTVSELTSIVRSVDVRVDVTESIDPVTAGSGASNLTYTVTVQNDGPSAASGVVLSNTLTLPAGVSVESVSPSGSTTWNSSTDSWTVGDLTVGGDATLTIRLTVSDTAEAGTDVISNLAALVAVIEGDGDDDNNSAGESTSIATVADLVVGLRDEPDPVVAGQTLTYTVDVLNNGPSDARNVVATATLPGSATLLNTSGCAEDPAGSPSCTLGTIVAGATVSYTIIVEVDAAATGTLSSSVDVTADTSEGNPGDEFDTATTTVTTLADMAVSKDGEPDVAVAGLALTYTIAITNYGPSVATAVEVSDDLPAAFEYGGDNCGGSLSGSTWSWAAGAVAANVSQTCVITGAVSAGFSGAMANTAVVSSAVTDPQPPNNSFTVETTVEDNQFSAGDATGLEGDDGTTVFTFTITRTTNAAASSVAVATDSGTAGAGSDYTSLPLTTIHFDAGGSLTQTVTVAVNGDAVVELDEVFYLNLSNPVNGSINDGQGAGTIVNDDSATMSIADVTQHEGDGGTTDFVFTVTLSAELDTGASVDYVTVDGTAEDEIGEGDYNAAGGTLNFSGAAGEEQTITVAVNGDVTMEADETFLVMLSNLDAAGRDVTLADDEAQGTIKNDDVAVVDFSSANHARNESDGPATISVTLSLPAAFTVTVDYASSDGSASAGSDYTPITGTLTFAPGETEQSLTLPVLGDDLDEDDETVMLTLSNAAGATLGTANNPATLVIVDDDGEPTVGFSAFDFQVGESSAAAVISVTLSHVSGKDVSVDYASRDETASAGDDYVAVSGRVTIAAGARVVTFTVPILDDLLDEADEQVGLTLSDATNAAIGAVNPAMLTIVDDDVEPTIRFSEATYLTGEGGSATITVTLSAPAALEVSVDYASNDGTATAGQDYTTVAGTITFAPGQTAITFAVPITVDGQAEADETVLLVLSNPTHATPGSPHSATLTIVDDDFIYYIPISLKGVDFPPSAAVMQRLR